MWIRPHLLDANLRYLADFRNLVNGVLTGTPYARMESGNLLRFAGMTVYINGVSRPNLSTNVLPINQWSHVHMQLSADHTTQVNLLAAQSGGGTLPSQLGMLATYPAAFTAAEILDLYNAHIGAPAFQVVEANKLRLSDSAVDAVKVYSYDWSVIVAG